MYEAIGTRIKNDYQLRQGTHEDREGEQNSEMLSQVSATEHKQKGRQTEQTYDDIFKIHLEVREALTFNNTARKDFNRPHQCQATNAA